MSITSIRAVGADVPAESSDLFFVIYKSAVFRRRLLALWPISSLKKMLCSIAVHATLRGKIVPPSIPLGLNFVPLLVQFRPRPKPTFSIV